MKFDKKTLKIGFIGQGWIGKNYADNFEARGYNVVRYGLEEQYCRNKDKISECDIVIIAVPTPSTPKGFDDSIIRNVIKLVGKGKIAVIKSTLLPGLTEKLQEDNPYCIVFHSPEFLREANAKEDTDNPNRNIIGVARDTPENRNLANKVISIMPKAPYELICTSNESEMIKYVSNCLPYTKIVFLNIIYDLCIKLGIEYSVIKDAMIADPMISNFHLEPVHKTGRGAGGDCLIKDFAALRFFIESILEDEIALGMIKSIEKKNIDLLKSTNKDLELLRGVYGE